jgi:hypothetical protein
MVYLKKSLKYILLTLACLLIFFVILTLWVINGNVTPAKEKIYGIIPYPLAFVGPQPVLMRDFLHHYKLAKKYYERNGSLSEQEIKNSVVKNLLEQAKLKEVASKYNVTITEKVLNAEILRKQAEAANKGQTLENLLKVEGMNLEDYKQIVVKPELLATNLTIWFNGQKNLNSEVLAKAGEFKNRVDKGENIEVLAKQFSEDNTSRMLGGDLGFVQVDEILPELQIELDSMPAGETRVLISRYGVHMVKLEEKDNKGERSSVRYHIKQVFLTPASFEQWYAAETNKIKVKRFIKV